MGLPSLRELFNEKYYESLPGGILESFGRLFKHDLRLYVCPQIDAETGNKIGIHEFMVEPHLKHLYDYLLENHYVKALDTVEDAYLNIFSHDVLTKIRNGSSDWEVMVPDQVVNMIKEKHLFNWQASG